MPIAIIDITTEQKDKILKFDEGHFLDLKAIQIAPNKLSRHISAFANADGGEMYVGISEDSITNTREWAGFSNPEAANAHLQVFEKLFPLSQEFSYNFLKCKDTKGLVLQLGINKTKDIKKSTDGKPYIRRGAQSLSIDTA
jgi:Divergent AAA domain.